MISKQSTGNYNTYKGTTYSVFAGNDYLGLARHPEVVQAAAGALEKFGVSFSASRQTTGTSEIHLELESLLARFKGQQDAIVFATGFLGNRMLLQALKGRYSIVFADSQAHPSIPDGIPCGIPFRFYEHCKSGHLENLLRKNKRFPPLIITDGIFALTGEKAPVGEIYSLAEKYNALLIVDDAHATGVLGENGRGTPEYFKLDGAANLYQSETMSKALGAYGGFIAGDKTLIQKIRSESAFYGASTALPPPLAAAGCAAIRLIQQQPGLREKLEKNAGLIRKGIKDLEFITTGEGTPIIPLIFESRQKAKSLSEYLKKNHIIAPDVDYPVKTDHFIVRITSSSNHTTGQIEQLLFTLKKWRDLKKYSSSC
jgi:7-keto-8-aminopelargonate synthetase-like enzyme